jgi:hypothetical protein
MSESKRTPGPTYPPQVFRDLGDAINENNRVLAGALADEILHQHDALIAALRGTLHRLECLVGKGLSGEELKDLARPIRAALALGGE